MNIDKYKTQRIKLLEENMEGFYDLGLVRTWWHTQNADSERQIATRWQD